MTLPSSNLEHIGSLKSSVIARDRRRAGRSEINPTLIPMLRGPVAFNTAESEHQVPMDPAKEEWLVEEKLVVEHTGNPARGILIGLLLVIPFWAIFAVVLAKLL